jgi:hypothetical protein
MDGRRYVCLTTTWRGGKARTEARQIDGLALPPGACCVHALPALGEDALSEDALAAVRKQHERGLERGSGRCLENVRGDLEAAFRERRLAVQLAPRCSEDTEENKAVRSAARALAGRDTQCLTSAAVVEELNRQLPGPWALEHGGARLQESTWRLRDALAPPPWGAEAVTLHASLLAAPGGAGEKATARTARTARSESLRETYRKVEARRRGTQGTPEAGNAERVLKKLKVLMQAA